MKTISTAGGGGGGVVQLTSKLGIWEEYYLSVEGIQKG